MGRCSHLTCVLREARTWTEKSTGEQPWSSFIIIKLELTLTNDRPRAENDWLRLSALLDITNPSATLMTETTRLDSFPPSCSAQHTQDAKDVRNLITIDG
ncbi:hypothetical protein OUZ56_008222 [Daphnia magna]|uniref:Uncharacterized protein n=1 Tax=Daphnia magna TaxID=35525 RepID=A0ABR0ACC4_9CRUS|nr:hypothetical protein OUZ56_008222 [Daphnia magna]